MSDATTSSLFLLLGVLTLASCQSVAPDTNKKADQVPRQDWDRMKDCAIQSHLAFSRMEVIPGTAQDYTNHYEVIHGKCFMEVSSTGPSAANQTYMLTIIISDAYEGRVYGEYIEVMNRSDRQLQKPSLCWVSSLDGRELPCKSKADFIDLSAIYMGAAHR